KERMNVYTKKTKLVAEMNQKVLSFYEKIRKWAKNTAVVPVKKLLRGEIFAYKNFFIMASFELEFIEKNPSCEKIFIQDLKKIKGF
ncbi:hypothetical protein VWN94_10095, partial [Campylobacter coli]|nr:hypothetical protein [Campylobacter coli]